MKKSKKGGMGILKRKRGEMSLDDMYHEGELLLHEITEKAANPFYR